MRFADFIVFKRDLVKLKIYVQLTKLELNY